MSRRLKRRFPLDSETTNSIDFYLDEIIAGDSLTVMRQMPSESIDLVVTSPPYNIKNSTGNGLKKGTKSGKWSSAALQNGYANHDDNMPIMEYIWWQNACLLEMFRLLKPTGAIFYNHKRRVQGGLLQDRDAILKDLPVRQIIIWKRAGGINFNPGYFLPTHEVIYLIPKPDFKLLPKANAAGDVWEFKQEMNNPHPAPFPIALPQRCIEATGADIILDPFMGSGTTALAAKLAGKQYIGIEISEDYVKMAADRLSTCLFSKSIANG